MIKIAICLRGQSRNSLLGAELFDKFFRSKFPDSEIRVFVHTWQTISPSSAGMRNTVVNNTVDSIDIVKYNLPWQPTKIHIEDDDKYIEHIKQLLDIDNDELLDTVWKTAQIYSATQSLKMLRDSNWQPDIAISTRHDTFFKINDFVMPNNDSIYTSIIRVVDELFTVNDDCFIMSGEQFANLTLDGFDKALKNTYRRYKFVNLNSHQLYPLLLFRKNKFEFSNQLGIEYARLKNLKSIDNMSYYEICEAIDDL